MQKNLSSATTRFFCLLPIFQNLVLDSVSFKFLFLISFTKDSPPTLTFAVVSVSLSPANEVWGKVIFLHLSVILFTGGVPGQVPPGSYTPRDQVHPLGPGTSPRTRYTPQDQVHPLPRTRYTPLPGTRYTPRTRYTPQGPGTPLRDQVHPPISACWEIQTTSGRYASYWNAFLFFRITLFYDLLIAN